MRTLALVVGILSVLLAGLLFFDGNPQFPDPTGSQSTRESVAPTTTPTEPTPTDGPIVYYGVLGSGRMTLYVRELDGRSEPRELASRPSEEEGDLSFIVSPDVHSVIVAEARAGGYRIEPVDLEDPDGPPAWRVKVDGADFRNGIWSSDGRYWSGYGDRGNKSYALVIDATQGAAWELVLRRDEAVQGFQGSGPNLVLRTGEISADADPRDLRFQLADPVTGVRRPISLDDVETLPRSSYPYDVAPSAGLWVAEDYNRNQLLVGDLRTGEQRKIAETGPGLFRVAFMPGGDEVISLVSAGEDACGASRYVLQAASLEGRSRMLWDGSASPIDFTYAPEGDFVGFDAWREYVGGAMFVVDTVSGRSVELPMPESSYLGEVLAITGGVRLPDPAVPAASARPPSDPIPAAELVAGAPQVVSGSVEYDPVTCRATIRVRLMAPGADVSLVVIDELPAFVLEDVERTEVWVDVVPRPRSNTVLVAYGDEDRHEQFLWTPNPGRPPGSDPAIEPLPLPPGWPDQLTPGSWRPDGDAIGMGSTRRGTYLWFELGDEVTRRIKTSEPWSQVLGWAADGSAIIIGRNGCIDFCDVVQTWAAKVRLSDGQTRDVTQESPVDGIVSSTLRGVSVHSGLGAYLYGSHIDFSQGMRVPGDFSLPWPQRAGKLAGDGPDLWSRDGRSLYVVADTDEGRVLFRIDTPKAGVPLRPKRVGQLPDGAELGQVEIAGTWAQIRIGSLGTCSEGLVDLSTGDAYLHDKCAMSEVWLPPG